MLELGQIQSTILREYYRHTAPKFERFVFVHFHAAPGARSFIEALLPKVTSCAHIDAGGVQCVLNIGLTYPAVDLFGFGGQARALDERDFEATGAIEAFKCGMKARARAILGDRGPSDPEHWQDPYGSDRIHAVVWLNAHQLAPLEATLAEVEAAIEAEPAVERLHVETAQGFTGTHAGTEQFGYADGIAQPSVLGSGIEAYPGDGVPRKRRGWDRLQPGEFVLGQVDESGQIQFRSSFFMNGSFMVFRKLRQHVGRFRDYLDHVAQRSGTTPQHVGAKMFGRWESGAPLVLSPDRDDPELGADPQRNNDFRYADDPHGHRCPFGAHARRNNPREDPTGPGAIQTRLHRIIRRSTPYGPRLPEGTPDDGVDRGVLFVVINADISRQFEFVQQNWVQSVLSSTVLTLPADRDPIIGQQLEGDDAGKFLMPSSDRRQAPTIAWGLPTFVTTQGGAYFLLPSLDALWDVAHGVLPQNPDRCTGAEQPDTSPPSQSEATAPPDGDRPARPSPCDELPKADPAPSPASAPSAPSESTPAPAATDAPAKDPAGTDPS